MYPSEVSLAACASVHLGLEEWLRRRMRSVRRKAQLQRLFHNRTSAVQSRRTRNHFPTRRIDRIAGLAGHEDPGERNMTKIDNGLLIAAAVVCSISVAPAFAKTAKECTAEWRADKVGMQARGVTEKAYVEQCRAGTEPTAAAPTAKPAEATPPAAPRQETATGSKTAKECIAEW